MKEKRKLKKNVKIFVFIIVCLIISFILGYKFLFKEKDTVINTSYAASETLEIPLYDLEYKEALNIKRGTKLTVYKFKEKREDKIYVKVKYNDKFYMINEDDLTTNKDGIVKEKELYVRTPLTVYKDDVSSKILSHIAKGEKLDIIGYDKIDESGVVNKYKIKYNDTIGYVYGKYLVKTQDEASLYYNENGILEYMNKMGDTLGGGTASKLDYYPYEKPKFEDNVMPDEVRALYLNSAVVSNIDEYISFAKENNINALVIDIKDNTSPAYNSNIMKEYSPTNYAKALNSFEDYKAYIKKAKDAGLYLIGRITTFKDSYFVEDHKEVAISSRDGAPFSHNGSYWPSAYNRYVWEFSVELAKEAVSEIGFNEIQFDYVRFPDRTTALENSGTINLNNTYNESKAEALQGFVMYATDELHALNAYVSIDVFGESASDYVTAYGQFWPAISNIADAISGMPYPDHFNAHEYGISEVVWTVPYKLLSAWGKTVADKQKQIPTPASVRTWIQAYDSVKEPSVAYDASKVSDEIKALYDNGLTGGYMTWNSGSNIYKYKQISGAFKKEY
ncbi:MAG: putative glycoside hydrolase [bacterium]|nr:putative glycoside hydrolase [bacterium]